MLFTILIATVAAGAGAVIASVVFTRASRRSALWNMAMGPLLALAVLAAALLAAILLANAAFPD